MNMESQIHLKLVDAGMLPTKYFRKMLSHRLTLTLRISKISIRHNVNF